MFKNKYLSLLLLCFSLNASAAQFTMPSAGNDIVGEITTVQAEAGDTLSSIGDHYGIGLHEMLEANPNLQIDLQGGERVIVPTQFVLPKYRKGIVINLAECRLYYFTPDGKSVYTYPVGLGRRGWRTPTTSTSIIRKTTNPTWNPPSKIKEYVYEQTGEKLPSTVPPGPENPLGGHAMYLAKHGYLIHGTNQPESIGKLSSAGCIRLHNEDVTELYSHVKTGTPVKIIHQPYKAGWQNGHLYLEAHMPVVLSEGPSEYNMISVEKSVLQAKCKEEGVNWEAVKQIVDYQHGVPEEVH